MANKLKTQAAWSVIIAIALTSLYAWLLVTQGIELWR